MTRQTADISNMCKYSWCEWFMFFYQHITYPYLPVILGRYLGPAIDVGSAITYKILKANGEYVFRTTVCLFNPTEISCSEHKQLWNNFDASVVEDLGPSTTISDSDYKEYTDITPDFDYYDDFDEDGAEGCLEESPSLPVAS